MAIYGRALRQKAADDLRNEHTAALANARRLPVLESDTADTYATHLYGAHAAGGGSMMVNAEEVTTILRLASASDSKTGVKGTLIDEDGPYGIWILSVGFQGGILWSRGMDE